MIVNWESYRLHNGTINLPEVYAICFGWIPPQVNHYLSMVNDLHPITSRQVAAMILVTANKLDQRGMLL